MNDPDAPAAVPRDGTPTTVTVPATHRTPVELRTAEARLLDYLRPRDWLQELR